jgi:vacuolar protein sorting-associated protein 8
MADQEDISPPGDKASNGEETVTQARDDAGEEDVLQLDGDEAAGSTAIDEPNSTIPNRYREIMQEQEEDDSVLDSADGGSVDALPPRPGSPMDSVLSGPDDTPSIQVCCVLP